MPTYTIAGITFFIPDLNDLFQYVIQPLEQFISQAQGILTNSIIASLNFLTNLPSQIQAFITATLIPAIESFFAPVSSFLQTIYNGIVNLPQTILASLTGTFQFLTNTILGIGTTISNSLTTTLTNVGQTLFAQLSSFITNGFMLAQQAFGAVTNVILQGLGAAQLAIIQTVGSIGTQLEIQLVGFGKVLSNVGEFTVSAFNQLSTMINAEFQGFGMALSTLSKDLWSFFYQDLILPLQNTIRQSGQLINATILNINNSIKSTLLASLPRSPEQALDSALTVAEIGVATFIAGEVEALVIEALYPTKHVGITETVTEGLKLLGVTEVAAAFYGIIVESGWGLQLQYYFNSQLRPRKPPIDLAKRGLYYGQSSFQDYSDAILFEGYNEKAEDIFINTVFEPIPARLLVSLLEDDLTTSDVVIRELRKAGLDPSVVPDLVRALEFKALKGFESNVKSIIFTVFKDGFLASDLARNIMTVFNIPKAQQEWILSLAVLQFQYEQKKDVKDLILVLVSKGQLAVADGIADLQGLGMSKDRAEVLVKTSAVRAAPSLSKGQRQDLLASALAISTKV